MRPSRPILALLGLIIGVLSLPWGCIDEESFFSLQEFDLSPGYDTVLVILQASSGSPDTVYQGPAESDRLDKIPAPAYRGEKSLIIVEGFKDGRVVYRKGVYYDGHGNADSTVLWKSPQSLLLIAREGLPLQIQVGDSLPLPDVSVTPLKLVDKSVTWSSLNGSIARIDQGMIRAQGKGTVYLVSRLLSDTLKQDSLFLQVVEKPPVGPATPDSLRLRPDTLRVAAGGAADTFTVDIFPSTADSVVRWKSLDSTVATVTTQGVVQGVAEGKTRVRVESVRNDSIAAEAWVVVSTPAKVDSVRMLQGDSLEVYAGGARAGFDVRVYPKEAAQEYDLWIEDTTLARLEESEIRGLQEGTTRLIARSRSDHEKADTLWIVVLVKVDVTGVDVKPDSLVLYTGGPDSVLTVKVLPAESPQEVIWRLVPAGIAVLDGNGKISPLSPGQAHAIAISKVDSLARDSAKVTVKRDVPLLLVGRPDTVVGVGTTVDYYPQVVQEYGGIAAFAWDLDGDGNWDDSAQSIPAQSSHTYAGAGSVDARFFVRDTEGNEATAVKKIQVVTGPVVLIISPLDGFTTRDKNLEVIWSVNGRRQDSLTDEILRVPGPNTIVRSAGDSVGNFNSVSITVDWDTVPPKAPVMTSSAWANTKTPTWTWTGGGGGNGKFRLSVDNPIPENAPTQSDTFFTALSELSQGLHTLLVEELDAAGNRSSPGRFALRIDLDPPSPPKVAVDSSPTRSQKPTWSWTGDAAGGTGIYRIRLDSSDMSRGTTVVTRLEFIPTQNLGEGSHRLFVQERDSAGNWSSSGSAEVRVDLTPPQAPVFTTVPASPTNNPNATWNWVSGGGGGMGRFRHKFLGDPDWNGETSALSFTANNLPEGITTLVLAERDSAGNWSDSITSTIRIDLTPPRPPVFTGMPETPTNNPNATWNWISGGGGGMGRFRYKFLGEPDWKNDTMALSFTVGNLPEEMTTLVLAERDSAGNWSDSITSAVRIDLTPPHAPVFSDLPRSPLNSLQPNWLWASGGNGGMGTYRCKLDDTSLTSGAVEVSGGSFSPPSPLTEGLHTLHVQEKDSAGNWSLRSSRAIVIALRGAVGGAGFSAGVVNSTSLALTSAGLPYVAFQDFSNGSKATVMRLNAAGTAWETVGAAGFSPGSVSSLSLALTSAGLPYVAFQDGANGYKATVMRLNAAGTAWETVGGAGFSSVPASYLELDLSNGGIPYVSFLDEGPTALVMRLNVSGSFWESVGGTRISPSAFTVSLALTSAGVPYVAFNDGDHKATVMRLNAAGTAWETVGEAGFSSGIANKPSLALTSAGVPYVSFLDDEKGNRATVMRLNTGGTAWETVGGAGFSAGEAGFMSLALTSAGLPYVAFQDGANGSKATVMRLNAAGTAWETVGGAGFSTGQAKDLSLALTSAGVPYVAFSDGGNGFKATVMKVAFDP